MYVLSKRLYRWVNQLIKLGDLVKNSRSFSVEWVFISALLLIFGCLGCASVVKVSLVPFLLLFSFLAFPLILCFRGKGYALLLGVFVTLYVAKYVVGETLYVSFWLSGLGVSFLLAFGLFLQGVWLAQEEEMVKGKEQLRLSEDLDAQRSAYEDLLLTKSQEKEFLDARAQGLDRELTECQELLKAAYQKQEYLTIDLKILADQKNSWLEDYAELHNKYIELVSKNGDVVFPWVAEPSVGESQGSEKVDVSRWVSALQEKEESLERLRNEILVEKQRCSDYEHRCQELGLLLQNFTALERRCEELQNLLNQKETQINELHQLVCKSEEKVSVEPSAHAETSCVEEKQYKGLYSQLQEQFLEKSETLSLVRKKLFAVQEKYLTLKKKEELTKQDMSFDDISMIQGLLERIEILEEEVSHLEELVSRSLSL
ncbi:conserved hypothetical protein [Chlamydia pneumoniae LPCoLN]|uniref:hypothetical protein n=1 Tax=Chlamydia pneumoniae TaxID=83558 RepID=UPI0001BD9B94|nr:hypothetical protein [Chlamydia pneumoniae]ACZ32911.1 conserved hypothetical protein [Chlamydia pneumoniae LPCoLN]